MSHLQKRKVLNSQVAKVNGLSTPFCRKRKKHGRRHWCHTVFALPWTVAWPDHVVISLSALFSANIFVTEKPGGLLSMGSHRVEHDWSDLACMHACIREGNGNPLQYSCLEKPRDRGAWWAAVYGVAQSQTRLKRLSSNHTIALLSPRIQLFNNWKQVLLSPLECWEEYRSSSAQTGLKLGYETESHSFLSDSLQPHGLYIPWNSPGQNTGVGSFSLLWRIFPTQGLNTGLVHCRILYQLSHKGSPNLVIGSL